MNRRYLLRTMGGVLLLPFIPGRLLASTMKTAEAIERLILSRDEWRRRLTPEQFHILREEGTEAPWSNELLKEKRSGTFHCVGCNHPLFSSTTKYDSKTGWPSFWQALPNAFETKKDYKLFLPRTEYHCARCGGHHGHIFNDGPRPTGKRYCNNGVALKFIPDGSMGSSH